MKHVTWKLAVGCCLAVAVQSADLFARGPNDKDGGKNSGKQDKAPEAKPARGPEARKPQGGGPENKGPQRGDDKKFQGGPPGRQSFGNVGGKQPDQDRGPRGKEGNSKPESRGPQQQPKPQQQQQQQQQKLQPQPQANRPQPPAQPPVMVQQPQQKGRPGVIGFPPAGSPPGKGPAQNAPGHQGHEHHGANQPKKNQADHDHHNHGGRSTASQILDFLPGIQGQQRPYQGQRPPGNTGIRIDLGGIRGEIHGGNQRHGHGNRPSVGTTIELGNRRINIGHDHYQPSYHRHSRYHGHWHDQHDQQGGHQADRHAVYGHAGTPGRERYRPYYWGLGGWGLGSIMYNSGYLGYSNPYYRGPGRVGVGVYNYSQPIIVDYTAAGLAANKPQQGNPGEATLNAAIDAFQQNDYDRALDIVNKGITKYPDDAVMHEFRALVLFAREDYQQAASTIHAVLAVGPGWDWKTLSSLYANLNLYTAQLRKLEDFTIANPEDVGSRFLLAYHYISCGHNESAARHLTRVVKLVPGDRVAADVLQMIAPPQPVVASGPTQSIQPRPRDPVKPAGKPVDPALLVGTWQAARDDGSQFELILTPDAKFTWKFRQQESVQEFSGKYSIEGNILALERKEGGSLVGEVTLGGEMKFNFKLLGAPASDTGLDFGR